LQARSVVSKAAASVSVGSIRSFDTDFICRTLAADSDKPASTADSVSALIRTADKSTLPPSKYR
jgi:hypothetical protein